MDRHTLERMWRGLVADAAKLLDDPMGAALPDAMLVHALTDSDAITDLCHLAIEMARKEHA